MRVASTAVDDAVALGDDGDAGVARDDALHAGADERRRRCGCSGTAWRCMFEPMSARFASSCSRNGISDAATDTSWFGDTSISLTSSGVTMHEVAVVTRTRPGRRVNLPFLSSVGVRLGDVRAPPLRAPSRTATSSVTLPLVDLAVRRLDEAVLVDARVGRQRRDEADVRTFRRLDRADAAVVRGVNVAHFEAGALAGQTAGPERRETTLVRDFARAGWSGP